MLKSASARFRRTKNGKTQYLPIHAWKKVLYAAGLKTSKGDGQTKYASDSELITAFVAACEQAESEGWKEYGPPTTWRERVSGGEPQKPTAVETEKRFEQMSQELAEALAAANGKKAAERKAIVAAVKKYGDLKVLLGGDRGEHAVHFFAVDGVGLRKKRKPALSRVRVDAATSARWLELLTASVK